MTENASDLHLRIDILEQRIERMSAAASRVNARLDLAEVLRELVDSACVLTRARYGIIATVDSRGHPDEFVSSGFTESENDQMLAWSDAPRLFEHFRDLGKPLRVSDLPSYISALGFSTELIRANTFQSAPLYHRGVQVGSFFLAGKEEDREFTTADEDILHSFSSHAAMAIANAYAHRNEQRVRTELDTLIKSSPVGVVVFSGKTGELISYNGEARRIVEELGTPGREVEELLDIVSCQRADGREVSLAEVPMVVQLTDPETVYAEELTLSVPDGRSVSLLCNTTPIRSADGVVESLVVIMQDLAPIKELARLRAEVFSRVSDELRTPLVTIKGSSSTALEASSRLDTSEMLQYFRVIDKQADRMRGLITDLLDYGRISTGTLKLNPVVIDVRTLIERGCERFRNEFKSRSVSVELNSDLPLVLVDSNRIEQVVRTLLQISSTYSDPIGIKVAASQQDIHVAVTLTVSDWHIPTAQIPHLFQRYSLPGSGERAATSYDDEIDLAICRGLVEANGGRIWAESNISNGGTQITFTLPIALDVKSASSSASRIGSRSGSSKDSSMAIQILVINANAYMQRYVQESLTTPEFETFFAEFDEEINDKFESFNPALILLDLQQYGFALQNRINDLSVMSDAPVIFIVPSGSDEIVSKALVAGAIDYVVTPFSPTELVSRVKGALRQRTLPAPFTYKNLQIDYGQRIVRINGNQVELTATEYELLRALSINAGRVMTYAMLIRQAWGKRDRSPDDPKLVRAVVKRLRQKLDDDAANPAYVCNKRGVGYFLPVTDG